jgi:hypothetical protein
LTKGRAFDIITSSRGTQKEREGRTMKVYTKVFPSRQRAQGYYNKVAQNTAVKSVWMWYNMITAQYEVKYYFN